MGAQVINEASAWSMSSLQTADAVAADAFYEALFGWKAEPFGPPEAGIAVYRLPGFFGGEPSQPVPRDVVAVRMPLEEGQQPHWHVDFWIDDAEDAAARTAQMGGHRGGCAPRRSALVQTGRPLRPPGGQRSRSASS